VKNKAHRMLNAKDEAAKTPACTGAKCNEKSDGAEGAVVTDESNKKF